MELVLNFENGILNKSKVNTEDGEIILNLENGILYKSIQQCENGTLKYISSYEDGVVSEIEILHSEAKFISN